MAECSWTTDIIMPIVGFVVPGGDWRAWVWQVGSVKFALGDFLGVLIDFFIIGFVVWRISKAFIRKAVEAPVRKCQFCRMPIDAGATRCPHCTSELALTAV